MITTPNMGLKVWNLLTDSYDSNQLADNWNRVDQHDHSGGRGLQIPTGGIQDGAITTSKLASNITVPPSPGSVTLSAIGNDVYTDYSYGQSQYKSIRTYYGTWTSTPPTNTITYGWSSSTVSGLVQASQISNVNGDVLYIDPADWAGGSNRTTYLRMRLWVSTDGGTAPAGTWTVNFVPLNITAGASSSAASYAFGAAVTGSPLTATGILASSRTVFTGADFAAPPAGTYIPTFNLTNVLAANQTVDVQLSLQWKTA